MASEVSGRTRLHHIALTVTDLEASVRWYEQVFSLTHVMDAPHEGGIARILADPKEALVLALHQHHAHQGEPFAETRTGPTMSAASFPAAQTSSTGRSIWNGMA